MGIFGIGTHGNVRIAQGLDYENFTSLAVSANDPFTGKGGEIGARAVRLTKDGAGTVGIAWGELGVWVPLPDTILSAMKEDAAKSAGDKDYKVDIGV